VELAPLVGCPLEVASERRLEALVLVGDDQLDALEPPPLQRAEQLLVGGPKLSVSETSTPRISLNPSSLSAETTRTPWLTTRCPTLTFS
jgi:hypothetical protein